MNSKILFAFVFAVNVCIITAITPDGSYAVFVRTASQKFRSQDGKMKLTVISSDGNMTTHEEFELTQKEVELEKSKTYSAPIVSAAPFDNITSVKLQWILASPFNPICGPEPEIYFNSITLSRITIYSLFKIVTNERKFCPKTTPIGIKSEDEATFNYCDQ